MSTYEALTMDSLRTEALRQERLANNDMQSLKQLLDVAANGGVGLPDPEMGNSALEDIEVATANIKDGILQLEELNDLMCDRAATSVDDHKIRQHKDNLDDIRSDLLRLEGRAAELALFGGTSRDILDKTRAGHSDMDHVLRERNSIHSAMRETSNVIAQAMATRESLDFQAERIDKVHSTTQRIAEIFPALGTLMGMIQRRSKSNDIVMAVWIGFLMCVFVWAVFL